MSKYQDLYGIVWEICQHGWCGILVQCKGSLFSWVQVGNQVITVRLLPKIKMLYCECKANSSMNCHSRSYSQFSFNFTLIGGSCTRCYTLTLWLPFDDQLTRLNGILFKSISSLWLHVLRQQGVGLLSELICIISPLTIHYLPVCNYVINSFSSHLTAMFVYHDSCLVPIDAFGCFLHQNCAQHPAWSWAVYCLGDNI